MLLYRIFLIFQKKTSFDIAIKNVILYTKNEGKIAFLKIIM